MAFANHSSGFCCSQGPAVCSHPNLRGIRRIKLRDRVSTFWRYQELGNTYLSTLEAMHAVCVEFVNAKHTARMRRGGAAAAAHASTSAAASSATASSSPSSAPSAGGYAGECDDLMFIYAYMHSRIKRLAELPSESDPNSAPDSAAAIKRLPKSWRPLNAASSNSKADSKK
jgi:hypothetical protein